ncbi:MAG TPA: TolC family protein [Chitinophagaceae bacterium]
MKIKSLLFLLICFVMVQKNFAQDTVVINGPLSLKECVEIALKNNLDVNRSELQMEDSKVDLTRAKGNMLPFVSGNINHGVSSGKTIDPFTNSYVNQNLSYADWGLNGQVALWNAGSIRNNIRANSLNYQASQMDFQQQKDNITISVILAYLQVLNNNEQLNAAQQQLEVSRKQVERLEVLNKDGAIPPADLYNLKGDYSTNQLNLVSIKNTLESSKVDLARLLNIPYSRDLVLEKINTEEELSLYQGTSQQIYQQAMQNLAMIKAVDLRKEGALKAVKSAKGQLYPSLVLNGNLSTNYSNAATTQDYVSTTDVPTDSYVLLNSEKLPVYTPQSSYTSDKISYGNQWKNNFASSFSIGLQIPILNGLSARSNLNRSKIEVKRADLVAKSTKTELQQQIEQAYVNMNTAYERYQTLTQQVQDYSESFRIAEVRFNAGAMNSIDYLIVKRSVDNANINLIAAKYDYILRTKILDFYQGRLNF